MKNIYSFTLALFISQNIFSQTAPDIEWQSGFGSATFLSSCFSLTSDEGLIAATCDNDYKIYKLNTEGLVEWQSGYGGDGNDYPTAILQSNDGGYVIGGYSESGISGDKSEATEGFRDFWIVKINALGVLQWENTIVAYSADELLDIIQTNDNGFIAVGLTNSGIGGDKSEPNFGNGDGWVVKLNEDGEMEWEKGFGGNKLDWFYTVRQTPDNGYIVGGYSGSGISGNKTSANKGLEDYWIIKLDEEGNDQWQRSYGGNSVDKLEMISLTPDGGYILGGTSSSGVSGVKTIPLFSSGDCWIIKIDSLGVIEWQTALGGSSGQQLESITTTSDNGYLVMATTASDSSGNKSENGFGLSDYWVIKLTTDGNIQWQKTLGGSGNDYADIVYQTSDLGYIACGLSESDASGNKTIEEGLFWLVKFNPENEPCDTPPTDLYSDFISSSTAKLHWSADPDAIKFKVQFRKSTVPTWTNTNATSNVKNLFSLEPSTNYKYRIKTNCGAGVLSDWSSVATFTTLPLREGQEHGFSVDLLLSVYPNPSSGDFTLEFDDVLQNQPLSISIKNLLGEEVFHQQIIASGEYHIQLNKNIANGMYVIEVAAGEKIFSQQIIVSK